MTAIDPETLYPIEQIAAAAEPSRWRRIARGLRTFARRSPLSAFWGCVAAAIIVMALAAPSSRPTRR